MIIKLPIKTEFIKRRDKLSILVFGILKELENEQGLVTETMTDISRMSNIPFPTLSRAIRMLAKDGAIKINIDPTKTRKEGGRTMEIVFKQLFRETIPFDTDVVCKEGVDFSEAIVLEVMKLKQEPMKTSELSEYTGLTQSSARKVIDTLLEKGLAERSNKKLYFELV